MSEIKLKPCPFCGGEAILDREDIFCDCCHVSMRIDDRICNREAENYTQAVEQTIEAWNTRKPMDAIVEALNDAGNQRVENAFGGREEWEALAYRQGTRKAIELMKGGTT